MNHLNPKDPKTKNLSIPNQTKPVNMLNMFNITYNFCLYISHLLKLLEDDSFCGVWVGAKPCNTSFPHTPKHIYRSEYIKLLVRTVQMKECTKCKKSHSLSYFYTKKGKPISWCKSCVISSNKKWRNNNKEQYNESQRKRNEKWRKENKDKFNEMCRNANRKRRDVIRERGFLYGNGNPRNVGGLLSGDGCCLICGESFPLSLIGHHIFGLEHDFFITLCGSCHTIIHRYPQAVLEKLL